MSFRRESYVPRGGPDGGNGGKGGDVIFQSNPQLSSLLDLRYKKVYNAGNGSPGGPSLMSGANGKDLVISVPPGTLIYPEGEKETSIDMAKQEKYIFLKGGRGGKGNAFYKTSVNQAPQVAQKGETGEQAELILELKLLADIGLIGLPNAGKSTLLSRISAAKPKVADYPFTTLKPHLGVVRYGDTQTYVVADIPGLIKGAHQGVGLGIRFLKHIERTKAFVHIIDGSEMALTEALEAYETLNRELKEYDQTNKKAHRLGFKPLSERPQILVINKSDVISENRRIELKTQFSHKNKVYFISAVTGENIEKITYLMGEMVFGKQKSGSSSK